MKKLFQRIRQNAKGLFFQLIIPFLIMLIVLAYFAHRAFIFIHPGEAGVLWKRFFGERPFVWAFTEEWAPSVDISETQDKLLIKAELPDFRQQILTVVRERFQE